MRFVRVFVCLGLVLTSLACGVKSDPLPPRDESRVPADGTDATNAKKKKDA